MTDKHYESAVDYINTRDLIRELQHSGIRVSYQMMRAVRTADVNMDYPVTESEKWLTLPDSYRPSGGMI